MLLTLALVLQAATDAPVRATLFAGDKIGTVVAVLALIFGGVVTWLVLQERRIRRLEQRGPDAGPDAAAGPSA